MSVLKVINKCTKFKFRCKTTALAARFDVIHSPALARCPNVRLPTATVSPFLSDLSLSLSVLRWFVPLLLARLRLRQTCYVITVGTHSCKFSVSSRVAATLSSRTPQRALSRGLCDLPVIYEQWKVHEQRVDISLIYITCRTLPNILEKSLKGMYVIP